MAAVGGKVEENGHFVVDKRTGLVVPKAVSAYAYGNHPYLTYGTDGYTQAGIVVERESQTGIWKIPGYGTGFDDFMLRTIVRGNVKNVGISPVVDAGLSSLVAKMQAMASTWEILLTGKVTPVNRAADIISMANDSDVGVSDFISMYIGSLLTENRGAFVAFAPFKALAFDQWEASGLRAIPIGKEKKKHQLYFLDMDTADFRESQGLWTLDGLMCYPTGNPEWPFWYRVLREGKEPDAWVLIHRDFGAQILYHIGGEDQSWPGMGQSPSWRYLNVLSQEILRQENDIESMLNRPPDGIVHGSGLDTSDQLAEAIKSHQRNREEGKVLYYPGTMFIGSVSENANVRILEFTRPPAGYDFETWKVWREDMLALAFGVSSSWVVTRIGTGSLTQSGVTHEIASQTGLAHLRTMIQVIIAKAVPPRVTVQVHYKSDRQTRFQVETLQTLANAIKTIQDAGQGSTLTVPEIRTIMEQHGLDIPGATEETQTGTVGDTRIIVDDESPDAPSAKEPDTEPAAEAEADMSAGITIADVLHMGGTVPLGTEVRVGTSIGKLVGWVDEKTVWVRHPWHEYSLGNATTYHILEVTVVRLPVRDQ